MGDIYRDTEDGVVDIRRSIAQAGFELEETMSKLLNFIRMNESRILALELQLEKVTK